MGRTTTWLAEQRPAMVEILAEMERSSTYTRGGAGRGDLRLLLARLSQVAAGTGGRPRSISAMRQAWWRWTTDGPEAGTPPVQELALMVRHAKNHGWLRHLNRLDCLSLVSRLCSELEGIRGSKQRALEVAWGPTVRIAVENLFDFLEARIAKRSDGDFQSIVMPDALAVQQEMSTMLKEVIERVIITLDTPRELFKDPHETDSLLQPFEGWPATFRRLASDMSEILNSAAKGYEDIEASLRPSPTEPRSTPQRKRIFGASREKPDDQ